MIFNTEHESPVELKRNRPSTSRGNVFLDSPPRPTTSRAGLEESPQKYHDRVIELDDENKENFKNDVDFSYTSQFKRENRRRYEIMFSI